MVRKTGNTAYTKWIDIGRCTMVNLNEKRKEINAMQRIVRKRIHYACVMALIGVTCVVQGCGKKGIFCNCGCKNQ